MKAAHRTRLFLIFFIVIAALAFLIVRPFIVAIILGLILAYLLIPAYDRLDGIVRQKTVSAILLSLAVVLVVVVPLSLFSNALIRESYLSYIHIKQQIYSDNVLGIDCTNQTGLVCGVNSLIVDLTGQPQVKASIDSLLERGTEYVIGKATDAIVQAPLFFLNIFIMFFVMFFTFIDGRAFYRKTVSLLPLSRKHSEQLTQRVSSVIYAVIVGQLVTAMAQGFIAGIGYYLFGLSSVILLTVLTAFFALIPVLGTAVVWAPAAVFLALQGLQTGDLSMMAKGAGLLLYGILIIATIDNIIKPKIIGDRSGIHPVLAMIGVLGGIHLLGIAGVIIGPLIMALLVSTLEIYEELNGVAQ